VVNREDAFRLQRDRLAALLDRLDQAVVSFDSDLRVSFANEAAGRFFGQPELVGRELGDPWPESSLRELASSMFKTHVKRSETRFPIEGGRRTLDVLLLPPDESGEALLVIAELSSPQLRERAEREFVANAAHQLRTPVSAIAGAIEVLQGGAKDVPDARDRFLLHIDTQCSRLVRLTRALLVLARAQALAEPPGVELVALSPLLESIAAGLHPGSGVRVRVDAPVELATLTNRDLLEQAVGNLAENAAKFTWSGEIVLCAERVDGEAVQVVVSDTGPGTRLPAGGAFERFYQDPDSQSDGFGLGLAIAAEAARVLGGGLHIQSSQRGTRAAITLPVAKLSRS
jgi:two-component system phosphate regulon sensor histidine kinase PhoR